MALLAKDGAKPNGTCFRRYRTDLIKIGGLILVSFVLFTLLNVVSAESDSDLTFDDSINELLSGAAESSEKDDPVKSGHHRVTKAQGVEHHVHHHHAAGPHSKKKHHVVKSRTRRKGPPSRHAKTRVPAFSDDEDFLSDSWGGSGSGDDVITPEPTRPHVHDRPTDPPIRPKLRPTEIDLGDPDSRASIVFFRVTLTLLDRPFEPELVDRNSNGFRRLSDELRQEMERVFDAIPGTRDITPVSFAPTNSGGQILVTFDIGSTNHDERDMKERIKRYVDYGTIGRLKVSPDRFSVTRYGAPQYPACRETEFTCQDGECVPLNSRCDGRNDCRDASDEYNCLDSSARECTYTEFKCGSGECLDVRRRCDRSRDCQDGSDEDRCPSEPPRGHTCRPGEFLCDGRRCIPESSRCNNAIDCIDRTDEANCTSPASPRPGPSRECDGTTEFRCSSGECIESFRQCDLVPDCPNAEDETYCQSQSCSVDGFQCDDASCIDAARRCDRNFDCPDRSDENNCPTPTQCTSSQFRCSDGTCIPSQNRCNGIVDCRDGSDERVCPCRSDQFQCNNTYCIPSRKKCDGYSDCQDGTDEKNCPGPCANNEFRCTDGTCLPDGVRCNRRLDCLDGSDEADCRPSRCRFDQFRCTDGTCLKIDQRCNGIPECSGSEDEAGCPGPNRCGATQFQCRDGYCISATKRCDRRTDCPDSSDEIGCDPTAPPPPPPVTPPPRPACKATDFICSDGACVNQTSKCDGKYDCRTGDDEIICRKCERSEFTCNNGQCVDSRRRCDGSRDCSSGEDEAECPPSRDCQPTDVICRDGTCLDARKRCDNVRDCPDGIDEENCIRDCLSSEFRCGDGSCINATRKCDRNPDCKDGSDEVGCGTCTWHQFRCSELICVDKQRRCNGQPECFDFSDEINCACNSSQFSCDNGQCVDKYRYCDRQFDCFDRSDERYNCRKLCAANDFVCADGACVDRAKKCDGIADCRDRSDESGCACAPNEFRCRNGECIHRSKRCDRRVDCADHSDEGNCPIIPVCGNITEPFYCTRTGRCIPKSKVCDGVTDCADYSDESNCGSCRSDQLACGDGTCISPSQRCNGRRDCRDASDESNCPSPKECAPNETKCRSGECIHQSKRCDGRVDCSDYSDEGNCAGFEKPSCGDAKYFFMCASVKRCVPRVSVCDKIPDCPDYSDELNCVACRSDQLACGDGTCVLPSQRCNGKPDCPDGSDELNCPFTACNGTFRCSNGTCLPQTLVCDGTAHCQPHAEDEKNCGCANYTDPFVCVSDGKCIHKQNLCDSVPDCIDYSDEAACDVCRSDQLPCGDGTCINPSDRCNGQVDCRDGSDEFNCLLPDCNSTSFRCGNGSCIAQARICDGRVDCHPNGDDERSCGCSNITDPFICDSNQKCILRSQVCDGVANCADYSDESKCDACRTDQLACGDGTCISLSQRCNGRPDCRDNSDEVNCPIAVCHPISQFRCKSGECVDLKFHCDGVAHCRDSSDEYHCYGACSSGEHLCGEGRCVKTYRVCDGRKDCLDGSDEYDCHNRGPHHHGCNGSTTTQFRCEFGYQCVDIRRRCDGRYDCRDYSDERNCGCSRGEFRCGDGRCVDQRRHCDGRRDCSDGSDETLCDCPPNHLLCDEGRCVPLIQKCDGVRHCRDNKDEIDCPGCRSNELACGDGACIALRQRCDGKYDCRDASDEQNCPRECDYALEHRCGNGKCINRKRKCDGVYDCLDRSDEYNCSQPECRENEYRCRDGRCIDSSRRCNGYPDCGDGLDEFNCTCSSNEFRCDDKCLDNRRRCDGIPDCRNAIDELNCDCSVRCDGSRCLSRKFKCDGVSDCLDGTDELDCPKPPSCHPIYEHKCGDGRCVSYKSVCNKKVDCLDASDEYGCDERCGPSAFRCRNGNCIPSYRRCDGYVNCADHSDETGCACLPGQFRCSWSGRCIDSKMRCDGKDDCPDRSDEALCGCNSTQFRCDVSRCVDLASKCDGRSDCNDLSDELDCVCPLKNQFRCGDGRCIPIYQKCNGIQDCYDFSDEIACVCGAGQFRCNDGRCVDYRLRCNRRYDCYDRSDERNCPGVNPQVCRSNEFRCRDGSCVDIRRRCDKRFDCPDYSDETDCGRPPAACNRYQFRCRSSGQCVDVRRRCDRRADCPDRSDEDNCNGRNATCVAGQFQCDNLECVRSDVRCDRKYDCSDGSDERGCSRPTCSSNEFQCNDGSCIESNKHCNRQYDCADRSDEFNCGCQPNQYQCASGECVAVTSRCDGRPDCRDRSDEIDCGQCLPNQYHCANGQCIERYQRCNGKYDCADYSDEADCDPQDGGYNVRVYPERQTIRQGREVVFRCRDEGPRRSPVKWSRADARSMPPSSRDVRGRLTMPSIQPEHAGTYICSAISAPQGVLGAQKVATLTVQPYVPPTTRPVRPPGICQRSEATCKNGECIPREYVCDGDFDCTDQSDESSCGYKVRCEPSEFQCDNQKCVLKVWRCDGENDCGDNSDEKSCKPNHPESACRYDEFQCQSGDQCIPKSFHCDGELDCQDNSDEVGCTAPTITQPPPDTLTVAEGETAVITCVAVGKPTPVISWRLNWGHIPSSPRVTTKSENGQGTVTIRDSRKTDGGAWSCEAINSKDSIIATPDCILVIKPKAGLCQPPLFNDVAETPNECLKCFCFGITSTCYSSNLYLTNISLDKDLSIRSLRKERDGSYEDVSSQYPANQDAIDFEPSSKEYSIDERVRQNIPQGIYFYWSLPQEFLGNQLHSYGGYLRFTFRYKSQFIPRPPRVADVILKGNGITLYHVYKKAYGSERDNNPEVRFWEGDWHKDEAQVRGDVPLVDPTTREDIMMVLQNLDSVLIRAIYDEENVETSLSNLRMDTATLIDKNSGIAVYVEKCSCPPGYTGSSCENCAIGYNRRASSGYLGECVPTTVTCNCNQHSDLCDPSTGECLNCQHNTEGRSCERCRKGYYGDAIRGTCQPCPCPRITPPNQFSPTCVLASDGEVTCDACPIGYEGRGCERCAPGYEGNPNQPGSQCQPKGRVQCDPVGSLTSEPSPTTGLCQCKPYATGSRCDQCKPNTYYLNPGSPSGCIDCFCMGITKACTSSAWYRDQVTLSFANNPAGVVLTDLQRKTTIDRDLSIDQRTMELTYRNFVGKTSPTFYWQLPRDFLGSKVVAYGGTLNYTVRYEPGRLASTNNDPDVQLVGNGITMIYRHRERLRPNILQTISIPMFESYWLRSDGQPTNREHLLMAIANISEIFIKATYTADTLLSSLHSVSMETATETPNGRERALAVEQCRCPTGYKGLSCEDCDSGYTRSGAGLYLGLCDPCICNGHSSDCDPEVGTCRNCQHNTAGEYCQECAPGYVGTATDGSPNDCRPQENDTGGLGCNCDRRGSVGFDCDYRTKSCRCKSNVQGRNCNSCKDGHFNLDASNPEGCASCFCFNITNQCTSSSYYRDQIRMQLRDLRDLYSHSFQVTNRYRSRTLTEGIVVNPNLNEMSFTGFPQETDAQETFYWSLPAQFLGNRLASYGGRLVYTQSYTANPDGEVFNDADVEIIGNGISIFYVNNPPLRNRETRTFEIDLQEKNWQIVESFGPTAAKREHFMKVLANVEALLIRASFNRRMEQSKLRDIMMDTANPQATGQGLATQVEQCNCPPGYIGLSCQECAPGYIRDSTGSGPGLGRCTRCNCNGHSESCDATTGRCVRCRDNTMGDNCERCVEGFYGDATRGTPEDCKPCPCPLTVPSNQFSRTCNLDTDGQPTCNACPVGYVGRLCEACAQNYRGNPLQIGSRCEPSRGTVQTIRVRVEGPLTQRVAAGGSVTFRCSGVSQVSDVSYTLAWTKEGGEFPSRRSTEASGVLTIVNVRPEDSGTYVCTGSDLNSVDQKKVTLIVEGAGRTTSPRVRIEPSYLNVNIGDPVEFQCIAEGFPEPELQWTGGRNNQLNPQSTFVDGIFRIPSARKSDEAEYFCSARNSAGAGSVRTVLFVKGDRPPVPDTDIPRVSVSPASYDAQPGETVTLECRVTGSPTPVIGWTFSNGPLPSTSSQNGGVLLLPRVTLEHSGDYVCTATNIHGTAREQTRLLVSQGRGPPTARVEPERQTLIQGSSGEMRCVSSGNPKPTVTWSKVGGTLSPRHKSLQGDTLLIEDVVTEDRGLYVCKAENPDGTAQASSIVEVERREVPAIELYPESTQAINRGGSILFQCRVSAGIPTPLVDWTRADGSPFTSNTEILNGGVIRFNRVTGDEEGVYICTAENLAGRVTAQANLQVLGSPSLRILQSSPYRVRVNERVRLECQADGDPQPNLSWYKLQQITVPMSAPAQGADRLAVLEINRVSPADGGTYACRATSSAGQSEERIQLIVEDTDSIVPEIVIEDRVTSVSVGNPVRIRCFVRGQTPDVRLSWSRPDDKPLPSGHRVEDGVLFIPVVNQADEGEYICTGSIEGAPILTAKARLAVVEAQPLRREESTYVGQTIELVCPVATTPAGSYRIDWTKENTPLPDNAEVINNRVRIRNARLDNGGRYICNVVSRTGRNRDFVQLNVKDVPTIEVRIEPSKEMVSMGDSLTLRCRVSGTRQSSTAQWSKVEHEGQFPDNVQVRGNVLTINGVKAENGGVYRCTLDSHNGSFSDSYVLAIQVTPSFNPDEVETRAAPLGSTMVLDCENNLDGPVAYTWSKQGAAIRSEAVTRGNSLTIPKLSLEDAGIYICTAKSDKTTMEIPTIVVITGTVPKFVPGSYMQMKTLPNAYSDFDVEVYFKPEEPNGLILFNGQDGGGDFISLGLSDGHVEFRLELGSGPAVIRSQEPVQMGIWHTARIIRKNKDGTLYVDDQPPVKGEAQGRFLGLDLSGPLYIGGVPSFGALPKQTGFASGFVGCVSKLKIKQTEHDLMLTAEDHGTTVCEGCVENPCLHGGVCQEALTATGYLCICPPGFSGQECEKVGEACYPGVCGEGRCVNKPGGGFDCYCPFGRTGLRCEREIVIFEPSFSDDAFVAYPKPSDVQRQMVFDMKIKPRTLDDGIILYCGQDSDGSGDFTSLTLKNKSIEFRFDTGSGPAVIRSPAPIQADQWVNVRAERDAQDGKLSVNGGNPVTGRSPGHTKGLNLGMDLFVGGVDKRKIKVSELVGVNHGFDGCVAHMEVNDVKIDLVSSVIDASNVDDCGSHTACDTNPCKNGGRCQVLGNAYKCVCPEGFRGRNCDNEFNLCDVTQPCKNGASCHSDADGYKCKCPLGFKGKNCEDVTKFDKVASFRGDGYVALEKSLSPPSSGFDTETIRVSFMTNHPNGLVFFHGQRDTEDGKDRDYVALAVVNGHLEFSYELGSGPAVIKSSSRVNDGKSHNVIIQRTGTNGKMELDGSFDYGSSQGILQSLNAEGDIYIGGVPEHELMTGDRYPSGFVGCVWGVEIQNSGVLDLYKKAKSGANVLPCGDNSALGDSPFLTEPIIR